MKRFNPTQTGYRYDRLIFLLVLIMIIGLVLWVMAANSFDFGLHPYFNCKEDICLNPYTQIQGDCTQSLKVLWFIPLYTTDDCRKQCDWCNYPTLTRGIYGSRPKLEFLLNNMFYIALLLIVIGFVLNHYFHNKGIPFDIEIPITKKLIINKKWLRDKVAEANNNSKD